MDARPVWWTSALGEQGVEAVPGLDRALGHAGREGALERFDGSHVADGRELRPAIEVCEGVGFWSAHRTDSLDVEHEGPLVARGRRDLEVLAVERHVVAIRGAVDVAPLPARADIHLDDRGRRAVLAPPARDELRVREGLPDLLAGSVEGALEHELGVLRIDRRRVGATAVDPCRVHRRLLAVLSARP